MLSPGSTIGILGGGQLGRMLAQAAATMGYHTHIYCPDPDSPAFDVSGKHTIASYEDSEALKKFAKEVSVVTYEFENIPVSELKVIEKSLHPSLDILSTCQHRVLEKQALAKLGIPTAPFAPVSSLEELEKAAKKIGFPCIIKTATMGYDGKGQVFIEDEKSLKSAWRTLDNNNAILEGFVKFHMEASVVVARDAKGNVSCYCPVQNIHKNHILDETIAPAPISLTDNIKAEQIARKIAEGMELVGLMAVEMFMAEDGEIVVNELAPRPHNSGHWTMDACITSQFEQTIRAVCGLPLGDTSRLCDAKMKNLIGSDVNDWKKYIEMPNAKLHLYGKKESRPGRKMGHVTFLEKTP
ncbi:MAG: 5-(carboxyamino)imidazole ribonucleotide synthase [Rickettsiales bacterium]